jgi:hypothetical protein
MESIVVNVQVNNDQQFDKLLKNLFYQFDLIFVVHLIEDLNDKYHPYRKKKEL